MAEIKCPMCSKLNPAELDVCQYCEARLKPLTDELSRSQPPIHPGEEPTEMDTGQLEPVLPQWLRDVRQQARDSADESAEQAPAEEEAGQPEKSADLLAGLQSQSEDDEPVPDWLAGLRGEEGQTTSEEAPAEEDDLAALRNMLGEDTPATQETDASALPGWISDLDTEEAVQADGDELSQFLSEDASEEPLQTESQPAASDSDFGWNADFETESSPQADTSESDTPFDTELPAWLQGADDKSEDAGESLLPAEMDTDESSWVSESEEAAPSSNEGDLPDWLAAIGNENAEVAPQQEPDQPASKSTTDWLEGISGDSEKTPQPDAEHPVPQSTTDWLETIGNETGTSSQQESEAQSTTDWLDAINNGAEALSQPEPDQSEAQSTTDWLETIEKEDDAAKSEQPEFVQPAAEGDLPDWLSSLGEESSEGTPQQEIDELTTNDETPDWASVIGKETETTATPETVQPVSEGELPDWLASIGEAESTEDELPAPALEFGETLQADAEDENLDLFSSIDAETAESEQSTEQADLIDSSEGASTFEVDEGKPISTEDVESIFSMDMPDWLSDNKGMAGGEATLASADAQEDDLRPAELPSWVQAMRPVESVMSESGGEPAEEQPMEERGPLAGLRGVLPAVPWAGPSSKPMAYSLKLQAGAEQQANATMLEQMLAEEIHPKPVSSQKVVPTQRLLRWVIALLLLLVVGGTVFSSTQINAMPSGVPPATKVFLEDFLQGSLPANAPVLMIFDYSAALSGEMEAAAAPLIDFMILKKAPRISLISSTPTGSGLAEKFMRLPNTQASTYYQPGQQYINLGYLPGGAAGVLAFSENPILTKPLTTTGESAWSTSVLEGVKSLADFKIIILLTDDTETARIWIEQTENLRGEAQFLVVSSAQSGPMIMPYHQSGQIDVMLTGLDDSAPIEQVNSGRPGIVRRYWDAYGFGLLVAVALIALGSLWSLFSGWQARRKVQVEE
jgi:hypothetical protein